MAQVPTAGTGVGGGQGQGGEGDGIGAAASQAYQEAIEGGASPQDAFEAATGAAQEVATEMGVPQADFDQGMDAASQAFGEAVEGGASAGEAFGSAMEAANDATDDGIDMGAATGQGGEQGGQGQGGEQGGQGMDAMDAAFADDGGDKGTPPPADDTVGAALDGSAAQSDASGTPAGGGQESADTFGEVAQDDGTPKEGEGEGDQSGGGS